MKIRKSFWFLRSAAKYLFGSGLVSLLASLPVKLLTDDDTIAFAFVVYGIVAVLVHLFLDFIAMGMAESFLRKLREQRMDFESHAYLPMEQLLAQLDSDSMPSLRDVREAMTLAYLYLNEAGYDNLGARLKRLSQDDISNKSELNRGLSAIYRELGNIQSDLAAKYDEAAKSLRA